MICISSEVESIEETVLPEHMLVWAVFERALRDIDPRETTDIVIMRDAIRWLSGIDKGDRYSFTDFLKYCRPRARTLNLTAARVAEARSYINERHIRRRYIATLTA